MKMDRNDMDDLLVKKMLGEASEEDQAQIEDWINRQAENQRYYDQFRLIWAQSEVLAHESTVNETEAWNRFKSRVEPDVPVISLHNRPWFSLLKIAAIVLMVAGAGWFLFLFSGQNVANEQITVRSEAQTLTDTLPDGSVVTLNKNSSISYQQDFTKDDTRKLILKGEAFFEVEPDKNKPFVIHVNDVTVTVVGTSFNIKSNVVKTEVIVATGLVKVEKATREIEVSPNESVSVLNGNKDLVKQKTEDEFYNYYKIKKFVCNDTPLWKLVEKLNEVYQSDIVIEGENLRNKKINTTFEQNALPVILGVISETFDIKVERNGDGITLK